MRDRNSYGEINLDVTGGREKFSENARSETPFRIALLGDFSGRANRKLMETGEALANRRPVLIDRDNFDSIFAKLAPRLEIPVGGHSISLKFADFEDFHPDSLFRSVEIFQKLRDTRDKLSDRDTFAQTADALGLRGTVPTAPPVPAAPRRDASQDVQKALSGDLLGEMVEATEKQADQPHASGRADALTSLVRSIIAPHVVPKADPRQAEAVALMDLATSAQMSALLHFPAFQALEAAWRAVFFLVRNVETSSSLKLLLIDISKEELFRDLGSSPDLRNTGLYRLLVEKTVGTPGAETWAVLAGNYTFEPTREDAALVARLAKVAAGANAPFITSASPALLGCKSVEDLPDTHRWKNEPPAEAATAWKMVRGLAEARYLGLCLPRFMIRLPYGKDTETTEQFDFEEVGEGAAHDDYLWANPAFAAALLMAQSFSEEGWELRPGALFEISGLPIHIYTEHGESRSKPCAEVLMTHAAAEEMVGRGLMPLVSLKDQPIIRFVRFQSFADPASTLAGRWSK